MKYFFTWISTLLVSGLLAQNPDEIAIRQRIEAAGADYARLPLSEVVKKHWLLNEKSRLIFSGKNGEHVALVADEMQEANNPPVPGLVTIERKNFFFSVDGDLAFVYNEQVVTFSDSGKQLHYNEVRGLVKINGEWKINIASIHEF